jgi:hypothetical protein
VVARPSIVAGPKYEDVSRAYIEAVHAVLTGEKIPSVAAADLEKELVEITGFRKGPPKKGTAQEGLVVHAKSPWRVDVPIIELMRQRFGSNSSQRRGVPV